jgi:hypothetical protein
MSRRTKPALRALERAHAARERRADEEGIGWEADLETLAAAVDAAAAAGADPNAIAAAVGGREPWKRLVRTLKAAGLR